METRLVRRYETDLGIRMRRFRLRDGGFDERQNPGRSQRFHFGQADKAVLFAAAEQQMQRIRQRHPVIEREAGAIGRGGERHDAVGRAFRGGIADHEKIIVVIDQLDRRGQELAKFRPQCADEPGVRRVEFGDKPGQLVCRC